MFAQYAETLRDMGWSATIPIRPKNKAPAIHGWQRFNTEAPSNALVESWCEHYAGFGIGLAFGPDRVIGVDLDFLDPDKAKLARSITANNFGKTPLVRVGQRPKTLWFYQMADGPYDMQRAYGGFEIFTNSGQCVMVGIHPKTNAPYQWVAGDTPETVSPTDLPIVTQKQMADYLAEMAPLREDIAKTRTGGTVSNTGTAGAWLSHFADCHSVAEMIEAGALGVRSVGSGARHFTMQGVVTALVMKGVMPTEFITQIEQAYCETLSPDEQRARRGAVEAATDWAMGKVWGSAEERELPKIAVRW